MNYTEDSHVFLSDSTDLGNGRATRLEETQVFGWLQGAEQCDSPGPPTRLLCRRETSLLISWSHSYLVSIILKQPYTILFNKLVHGAVGRIKWVNVHQVFKTGHPTY